MGSKGNTMVRTMIAKESTIDAGGIYTKGAIVFTRSFHDRFYVVSVGMNTKVQGRLPLLQCITFQSLLAHMRVVGLQTHLTEGQ